MAAASTYDKNTTSVSENERFAVIVVDYVFKTFVMCQSKKKSEILLETGKLARVYFNTIHRHSNWFSANGFKRIYPLQF